MCYMHVCVVRDRYSMKDEEMFTDMYPQVNIIKNFMWGGGGLSVNDLALCNAVHQWFEIVTQVVTIT